MYEYARILQISTQDRTARDEQTTPEDTAHATAHPDPKTTTAKMHKPQPPPPRVLPVKTTPLRNANGVSYLIVFPIGAAMKLGHVP